jgi:hypothetical protein
MPKPRRIITRMQLDRVDVVTQGANFDPETNDGAHILLMKRAPDVQPPIAPLPFSREAIQGLIDSEVQKIAASMSTLAITKESTMSKFAEESRLWQETRTVDNEAEILDSLIRKASRLEKSAGGRRSPHEVLEAELMSHAVDIAKRDGISRHAAIERACKEYPELRAASNIARRDVYSRVCNE